MKFIYLLFLSFFASLTSSPADQIVGKFWVNEKTGKIEIYKCGDNYCGKIIWRQDARKDSKNPDKNLRNRSVIGIDFLKDFKYNPSKKVWSGGTVYSIDNGKTYKGKLWLTNENQTLKMRGFIGFSLLGKTATLERIE